MDGYLSGTVSLRCGRKTVLVPLAEIERIESSNHHVMVYGRDGTSWRTYDRIQSIADRLPPEHFVRISRFSIANVNFVKAVQPKSHGDQTLFLQSGATLLVSRTRRRETLDRLASTLAGKQVPADPPPPAEPQAPA